MIVFLGRCVSVPRCVVAERYRADALTELGTLGNQVYPTSVVRFIRSRPGF